MLFRGDLRPFGKKRERLLALVRN